MPVQTCSAPPDPDLQIAEKKSEAEREGRRRERLEREVRDLKAQVEAKNMEVRRPCQQTLSCGRPIMCCQTPSYDGMAGAAAGG